MPPHRLPTLLPRLPAPTVSIVVCNHDHGRFLQEAIDSALAQVPSCQLIVVDDGSTDGSRALLAAAGARVEVVLQPNRGQLAAYGAGHARCRGDVVIFLDADDALLPGAAAAAAALFDAGVAKVHWRMALVGADGRALGGTVPSALARGDVLTPLRERGLLYASAPGSGNAYRRSVLDRLFPLPLDAADRVGADFFLIHGAVAFGAVAACDAVLGHYRLHAPPRTAADALVFGNAAIGNDEAAKVASRYQRLRGWLAERSDGAVRLPPRFLDFSVQKSTYARSVLDRPYLAALFGSGAVLRELLRAVWLRPEYGARRKLGLSAWALAVMLSPRPLGLRMARFVCNPASRA